MNIESKLTKYQAKSFFKAVNLKANGYNKIRAEVRYDDRGGTGYNTFSIAGKTWCLGREDTCGCLHGEIAKHFPELKHLIKWHSVSSDGPRCYIDNTLYYARAHDIEAARHCAIWPDATIEQLRDPEALKARLPALMAEFRADIEALGFVF